MNRACHFCGSIGESPSDAPGLGPKGWFQCNTRLGMFRVCSDRCKKKLNKTRVRMGQKPIVFLPTLEEA